jgi:hypothetical protein
MAKLYKTRLRREVPEVKIAKVFRIRSGIYKLLTERTKKSRFSSYASSDRYVSGPFSFGTFRFAMPGQG